MSLPEILLQSFSELDLISGVGENEKICFKTGSYISKNSLYGSFHRYFYDEKMDTNGITSIKRICSSSCELYLSYIKIKENKLSNKKSKNEDYEKLLLERLINARSGLSRLKRTYDSLGKTVTGNNISNNGIVILDLHIPNEIKLEKGFLISEDYSNNSKEEDEDEEDDEN